MLIGLIYWPIKSKVMGGAWLTGLIYFTCCNCWRKMTSRALQVVPLRLTFVTLPPVLDLVGEKKCRFDLLQWGRAYAIPELKQGCAAFSIFFISWEKIDTPRQTLEGEKQQKHDKYVRANVAVCYFNKTEFPEPFLKQVPELYGYMFATSQLYKRLWI